jgi:hypothetical protein
LEIVIRNVPSGSRTLIRWTSISVKLVTLRSAAAGPQAATQRNMLIAVSHMKIKFLRMNALINLPSGARS